MLLIDITAWNSKANNPKGSRRWRALPQYEELLKNKYNKVQEHGRKECDSCNGTGKSKQYSTEDCLYRKEDICFLRKQKEIRGLRKEQWHGCKSIASDTCVFCLPDKLLPLETECPLYTLNNEKEIIEKEEQKQVHSIKDNDHLPIVKYDKESLLSYAIKDFGHTHGHYIEFCMKEGVIHPSYCIYCTGYSGRDEIGSKRRASSNCTIPSPIIGEVRGDSIHYVNQYTLDKELDYLGYKHFYRKNIVLTPPPPSLVKNAYLLDITEWDRFNISFAYCYHCGPKKTKGVHYMCEHCGTRQLCDNCIKNRKEVLEDDNTRTIYFTCHVCGEENNINFGPDDISASKFSSQNSRSHELAKTPYWDVDYYLILSYLDNKSEKFERKIEGNKPSADAKAYRIKSDMIEGIFYIDHQSYSAWRVMTLDHNYQWQDSLIRRMSHQYTPDTIIYDVILSYSSNEIILANQIKLSLYKKGISVFLLESTYNYRDYLWAIRYTEMLFRSSIFCCLLSETYQNKTNTIIELKEATHIEGTRNLFIEKPQEYIVPFLVEKININNTVSQILSGREVFYYKEVNKIIDEIANALWFSTKKLPSNFMKLAHDKYKIKKEAIKQKLCLNCGQPVYFHEEDKPSLDTSKVKRHCIVCKHKGRWRSDGAGGEDMYCNYKNKWVDHEYRQSEQCSDWSFIHAKNNTSSSHHEHEKGVALICLENHRFCSKCHIKKDTGFKACPKCLSINKTLSGHKIDSKSYYSRNNLSVNHILGY